MANRLPPVIAELVTSVRDGGKEWTAYADKSTAALASAAKAAEAEATKMEAAAERAALASVQAAEKASLAAEQVATRSKASSDKAVAQADRAAADLHAAYARTEALMQSNTATAAEVDAAVKAEAAAMDRLQAAAVRANESMARGAATTAQAMARADVVTRHAAETAAEASKVAAAARATADKAAASAEAGAAKSAGALAGLKGAADKALLGTGVAIAGIGYESVKMAGEYQKSTKLLQTGAGETKAAMEEESKGMLAMSGKVGESAQELSAAMYVVDSSMSELAPKGHTAAQSLEVLQAAEQGAKTDGADAVEVTKALTTVMGDLHAPIGDAANIMSEMVAAVGQGKMKMNDLATAIPHVLPNAAALGLTFQDVGGALATMTAQGMSAEQSAQNLNYVITHLANPTAVMTKSMAAFGISSLDVSKNLGKKGLSGTLDELYSAVIRQSKGGIALQSAFMANKVAAEGLVTMYSKLPAQVQKLADQWIKGTITTKEFNAAIKNQPEAVRATGAQFLVASKNASGFSQALRSGKGDLQTVTGALADMTGGMTGLNVVTHLTGKNMETFKANSDKIGAATADANGNVKDFDDTMKGLDNQLATVKAGLGAMGITLGTELIPPLSTSIGFLKDHTTTLKILGGVVAGVVVSLAAYSLTMKTIAMVQGIAKGATILYEASLKRLGLTTATVATEQDLLGGSVGRAGGRMSGLAAGVGKASLAYLALAAADSAFSRNASVGVNTATKDLQAWVSTGKSATDLTGNMDHDLSTLRSGFLDLGSAQKGVASFLSGPLHMGWLMGSSDMRQTNDRIASMDAALAGLVADGHMDQAKVAFGKLSDAARKQGTSLDELKAAFPQYANALAGIPPKANSASSSVDRLNNALDSSHNRLLSAHEAASAYYAAIDAVTASIKENGRGLALNTEQGRANTQALDGLVKASLDRLQALRDSGAPAAQFNKALEEEKTALAKAAGQATTSKTEIKKYVDQLGAVPKAVDTTVRVLGATTADAALQGVLDRVALINGRAAVVQVSAGAGNVRENRTAHAAGGLLEGPGTGTSDDIPILASNGEYVVNAAATTQNLPLLEAINSGNVSRYASGGRVSGPSMVASLLSNRSYVAGAGGSSGTPRVKLSAAAKQAAADLKSAMNTVNHWIPAGIAQAVERGRDAAIKEIQTLGVQITKAHNAYVTNLVKTSGANLIKLGTTYDTLGTKLKDAQARLKQLQDDSTKLAESTASTITGTGSILDQGKDGAAPTVKDITGHLQGALEAAREFNGVMFALSASGLNQKSLSELAQAGPAQGLAAAKALMQGGTAAIEQVNDLEAQLEASAKLTGHQVGDAMYQAGIQSAQGLADGLKSQEAAVLAQITKMAMAMVVAVKKQLKIKSPSKVADEEVGQMWGAGLAQGLVKSIPTVKTAAQSLVPGISGFSVGGIPPTGGASSANGSPTTLNATIHVIVDGQRLFTSQQKAALRNGGRNTTNGLALPAGR